METWFIYALLSALFAGLYSFFLKISAHKNHSGPLVTAYAMFSSVLLALIVLLFSGRHITIPQILFFTALGNGIAYTIAIITRIESLKYISSVLFFPINKTIGPILVVGVSFFIFSESLTMREIVGITTGILVPLLLIHKSENTLQINLKRGLILLLVSILFGASSSSTAKVVTSYDLDPFLYLIISFTIGGILALSAAKARTQDTIHATHKIKRTGIIGGVLLFFSCYFFIQSTTGNLGVVYTINSFSILIPIILSIFIYKEHWNLRKAIAIALSILSLLSLH